MEFHPTGELEPQMISAIHRGGYTCMARSLGYLPQNHQNPNVTTYRVGHNHPGAPSLPAETGEPDYHLLGLRHWLETYLETGLGNYPKIVKPGYEHRPGQFSTRSKPGWVDFEREYLSRYLSDRLLHAAAAVYPSGIEEERSPLTPIDRLVQVNSEWAERIEYLNRLEPGWDGYGSDPIAEAAVDSCCVILEDVAAIIQDGGVQQLFIAPLADGGLELEWDFPSGNELMIVVPPEGKPVRFLSSAIDVSGEEIETSGMIPGDATIPDLFGATTA